MTTTQSQSLSEQTLVTAVARLLLLKMSLTEEAGSALLEEIDETQGLVDTITDVLKASGDLKSSEDSIRRKAIKHVMDQTGRSLPEMVMLMNDAATIEESIKRSESLVESVRIETFEARRHGEWEKAKADFVYFCKCLTIPYRAGLNSKYPDGGSGDFELNEHQIRLAALLISEWLDGKPVRNIILKARQLGITTVLLAFWLWLIVQNEDFVVFFLIDKGPHLVNKRMMLIEWAERINLRFPESPRIVKKDAKHLIFSNRSKFLLESAESPNPGTSEKVDAIHLSEMPKWPRGRAQQVMKSLVPGLPERKNTFVVNESTAEGMGHFYKMWIRAMTGKTSGATKYNPIFLSWKLSDEYSTRPPAECYDDLGNFIFLNADSEVCETDDTGIIVLTEEAFAKKHGLTDAQIYWRRLKIKNAFTGSRDDFDQEYPTTPAHAWTSAGRLFFGLSLLRKVEPLVADPVIVGNIVCDNGYNDTLRLRAWTDYEPKIEPNRTGPVAIFEWPQDGKKYKIGGDVAEGKEVTNDQGKQDPDFSTLFVLDEDGNLVARYKGRTRPEDMALMAVLLGSMYNYAQINIERNSVGEACWVMFKQTGYSNYYVREGSGPTQDRAWNKTTNKNRRQMLIEMRQHIKKHPGCVRDKDLYHELSTFIIGKDGKPEAMPGEHDDCVFGFCHAFHMIFEVTGVRIKIKDPEPEPVIDNEFAAVMEHNGLQEGMW